MAVAHPEVILPLPNPLWDMAADWVMEDLHKGLIDPKFPKKLHEALWWGNIRWAAIIALGVTGTAVAARNYFFNEDRSNALLLPEPKSTPLPTEKPTQHTASSTPYPTDTELPPTPKPLPSMTFTLPSTETPTPTATVTETAATPLIPSEYALKAAGELGEGAKAMRFLISNFEGKYDGLYGKEWYYTAESGDKKWILAIFANYYDPTTGKGNICLKGDCRDLVGKEIDIIVPPGPENYDPEGESYDGRPYVYAAAIIVGEK